MFHEAEEVVIAAVDWLRLVIESIGAGVIGVGVLVSLSATVSAFWRNRTEEFVLVRLSFARYLALALEFQLAADILSTAVAPSWDRIGKLAAIAVIRTALNWFLTREMHEARVPAPGPHGG